MKWEAMLRQTCLTILYGSRPEVLTFRSHPQFWGNFQKNTNISPLKIHARTAYWTPVNLKASVTASDKRQKNTGIEQRIRTITSVPMKDGENWSKFEETTLRHHPLFLFPLNSYSQVKVPLIPRIWLHIKRTADQLPLRDPDIVFQVKYCLFPMGWGSPGG